MSHKPRTRARATPPHRSKRPQPRRNNNRTFPLMNTVRANSTSRPVIPSEMDKVLCFQVNKVVTNPAGLAAMVRFTPNGAYDVDPVLGSTSTPGFAEWSNFYNYYRVIKVSYKVEVANTENFPVRVYSILMNTDPGTVGNSQFAGNPLSRSHLLSVARGLDRATLSDTRQVAEVVGTRGVETEDNYRAQTNANPLDLIWLGFGAFNPGTAFLASGVVVVGSIKMFIRFYDPKPLFI